MEIPEVFFFAQAQNKCCANQDAVRRVRRFAGTSPPTTTAGCATVRSSRSRWIAPASMTPRPSAITRWVGQATRGLRALIDEAIDRHERGDARNLERMPQLDSRSTARPWSTTGRTSRSMGTAPGCGRSGEHLVATGRARVPAEFARRSRRVARYLVALALTTATTSGRRTASAATPRPSPASTAA